MSILKDISELRDAGIISEETAEKIRDHYKKKGDASTNRLFIVFGILGALLVGLGIILIVAHNWDELSRNTKTFFSFLPLLIGQAICGYTLIKKQGNNAWRESGSTFLFLAIGAGTSLISQVYHIPGDLDSFLLTWMLLSLPLIYVMKSSMASLLYLIGITYYASEVGYWSYPSKESYLFWVLLLCAMPHYYLLYKKRPEGNFMVFHNWFIPLSVVITLGTIAKKTDELMFIAYISLFGLFYSIGNAPFFSRQKLRNNGYKMMGSIGTLIVLFTLSFNRFWRGLRIQDFQFDTLIRSPEFFTALIITLLAGGVLFMQQKGKPLLDVKPMSVVFLLFIPVFFYGLFSQASVVLINMFVLIIGILSIRDGAKQDHLGRLNYGLLIITALVICRFFDTDLSFILRGILFLLVGTGFFAANYRMLKKRRRRD